MSVNFIREWLVDLSRHVPKTQETGDLALLIDSIAAMLFAKAPLDLFTADSLEFCLRRFKFFPSYAELWARLQTYKRESPRQSDMLALPAPPPSSSGADVKDSNLPGSDRVLVGLWLRDRDAGKDSWTKLRHALSVIHRYAPRGFDWLIGNDATAKDMALDKGWIREPEPVLPEQPQAKRAWAMTSLADVLNPPAPVANDVTPPCEPEKAKAAPFVEAFEAKHGRRPGALSVEATAAIRQSNPLLRSIGARQEAAKVSAELAEKAAEVFATARKLAPVDAYADSPWLEPPDERA